MPRLRRSERHPPPVAADVRRRILRAPGPSASSSRRLRTTILQVREFSFGALTSSPADDFRSPKAGEDTGSPTHLRTPSSGYLHQPRPPQPRGITTIRRLLIRLGALLDIGECAPVYLRCTTRMIPDHHQSKHPGAPLDSIPTTIAQRFAELVHWPGSLQLQSVKPE